jgi:hypothetical protein
VFNSKDYADKTNLILAEMACYNIARDGDGYRLKVGDEEVSCANLSECREYINRALKELKDFIWDKWGSLAQLSESILKSPSHNDRGLDLVYLLANVKKSITLANRFSDLRDVESMLREMCDLDVAQVDPDDAKKFNTLCQQIRVVHHLIMREIYRLKLVDEASTKTASIAGPWQNLDLEMDERVWEWDDSEEEYFGERQKEKRDGPRYNPEYNPQGFYFWFDDKNRDPYLWEDRKDESPYPSHTHTSIP